MHILFFTLLPLASLLFCLPLAAESPATSNTLPAAPSAAIDTGWTQRLTMVHSESLGDFTMR